MEKGKGKPSCRQQPGGEGVHLVHFRNLIGAHLTAEEEEQEPPALLKNPNIDDGP